MRSSVQHITRHMIRPPTKGSRPSAHVDLNFEFCKRVKKIRGMIASDWGLGVLTKHAVIIDYHRCKR